MIRAAGAAAAGIGVLAVSAYFLVPRGGSDTAADVAQASAPCTSATYPVTVDQPAPVTQAPAVVSDTSFDCMAWQAFITLNWPAAAGQQGVPDASKPLGAPGTPVWQTFATVDQVFLPNGARPVLPGAPSSPGAQGRRADGTAPRPAARVLTQKSKISPAALATRHVAATPANRLMRRTTDAGPGATIPLDPGETGQADGNVLIDQNGRYAYYEELLNPAEVTYIVDNGLYEAGAQNRFASRQAIALPSGSMEIKAAWKILGAGDDPTHFVTAQAYVDGSTEPVTVGLIGMHVMMRLDGLNQGVWATFQQLENVPAAGAANPHYSFYNPSCPAAQCPVNAVTTAPTPTQVRQVFPPDRSAVPVNRYVAGLLASRPQARVFTFYQLIDVQWPTSSGPLAAAPQPVPLATGSPNHATVVNPVLETFLQTPNTSCIACHAFARTAAPPPQTPGPFASSFSFLLVHAKPAS